MEKILVVTRDPLVREKLSSAFNAAGARAVAVRGPEPVWDYLTSGEVGLVVADGASDWPGGAQFLTWWTRRRNLRFLIAGKGPTPPPEIGAAFEGADAEWRWVDREHLVPLAMDIVGELAPDVLPGDMHAPPADSDRRRAERHERSLRIFPRGSDCPGLESGRWRTVDISTSGARVITSTPLCPDSPLDLRLLLPLVSREIPLRARVIWSGRGPEDHTFQSGLFFDRLDDTDRFSLGSFLSRQSD